MKTGFQLEYHEDTLCFVVISSPSFFEKGFIPFVRNNTENGSNLKQDYLDQAISSCLKTAIQVLEKSNYNQNNVIYKFVTTLNYLCSQFQTMM